MSSIGIPHRKCDDAEIRCGMTDPRGRGGTVRERCIQPHHVRPQGGAQHHCFSEIHPKSDGCRRWIASEDLGEPSRIKRSSETTHDAQTPCIGCKQARPLQREVRVHGNPALDGAKVPARAGRVGERANPTQSVGRAPIKPFPEKSLVFCCNSRLLNRAESQP